MAILTFVTDHVHQWTANKGTREEDLIKLGLQLFVGNTVGMLENTLSTCLVNDVHCKGQSICIMKSHPSPGTDFALFNETIDSRISYEFMLVLAGVEQPNCSMCTCSRDEHSIFQDASVYHLPSG
ncbi:hypothetical protein BDB00DRAFT_867844 [Zychaea mexicana]|uniref:uncharacterized protein n=1 Tax=Zychaea mexicana TaxID=64656 RepID=UPI0022FF1759|nr:uncharacterized protein BDB00DRAFT_867844 [Zychaea mexicana]KAI9498198.1 hypothetical protein BDB00DRAFT_867844 [Zychaea mexicana]